MGMTREEKTNLLNELLEYEENNDIGNLTRAERREFQQWISEALEQEPRWISMVRREPTDEEKAEYFAQGEEIGYILENEMPLNGQEVLVSIGELVSEDVFSEDAYNFENNDIENVTAWMPLPKPYKESEKI